MNESMLFSVGNSIIHPAYGAGIIVDVTNIVTQKVRRQLYKIKLLGTLNTLILVPVNTADKLGLRHPVSEIREN